jgi:DNA-binding MarR family transcriptional regulator
VSRTVVTRTPHPQTLIILMRRGLREMLEELVSRLHAAGYPDIRPAHSQVMENIDRDGTRLTELAARASMSHPSMLELVVGLERLGHVERVADPTDARARLVRLTAQGRRLQRTALKEIAQVERAWLERLARNGDPDLAAFLARRPNASSAGGGHGQPG